MTDSHDHETPAHPEELRVRGEAILYRLFDVGYEIRLDEAASLLASSGPERLRPVRGEAQAIQIPNPPVTISLGTEVLEIGGRRREIEISARVFDFGVLSLRGRIVLADSRWEEFAAFGGAVTSSEVWRLFERPRDLVLDRIRPAIERPDVAPVTEEYTVFRVDRLEDATGRPWPVAGLRKRAIERLLIGESRPLSSTARAELLSQRFTYFEDDLAVLTWNAALVVEPTADDTDVQYVLEFANAQLLELRYYDHLLDTELPRIYDEIAAARRRFHLLGRRYSRLLVLLQTRVADATEAVERVENSLKVTDDVFLARIYAAAIEIFRGPVWRRGIDRKVALVRDAYSMLNAESQARRGEFLELTIVLLIVVEILLAMMRHG